MSFYPAKQPDLRQKKNAQVVHAQRRARERLGADVDVQEIAAQIKNGQSKFLRRESLRVSHHLVNVQGKPIEVVYDSKRNQIVTFLFPDLDK